MKSHVPYRWTVRIFCSMNSLTPGGMNRSISMNLPEKRTSSDGPEGEAQGDGAFKMNSRKVDRNLYPGACSRQYGRIRFGHLQDKRLEKVGRRYVRYVGTM